MELLLCGVHSRLSLTAFDQQEHIWLAQDSYVHGSERFNYSFLFTLWWRLILLTHSRVGSRKRGFVRRKWNQTSHYFRGKTSLLLIYINIFDTFAVNGEISFIKPPRMAKRRGGWRNWILNHIALLVSFSVCVLTVHQAQRMKIWMNFRLGTQFARERVCNR